MNKWTIAQLNSTDDISFAIAILNERRNTLNIYAPLAEKIKTTIKTLETIKTQREAGNI